MAEATPEIFNPQNLANTAWAFAKLFHRDDLLFTRMAQLAEEQIEDFSAQNLSNILWAFAKVQHDNFMFFELTSYHILRLLPEFSTQAAVNSVWAMAEISYHHRQVFCQVAEIATKRSESYKPQDLSNLIWSFAEILHQHDDLLQSVAKATCSKIGSLRCQHLACVAWSYAHFFNLKCLDEKPARRNQAVPTSKWTFEGECVLGFSRFKALNLGFLWNSPRVSCQGRDPHEGSNVGAMLASPTNLLRMITNGTLRLKPFSKYAADASVWGWSVFGDGQCARSFQHQAGKHQWSQPSRRKLSALATFVDEYLLVMESAAGNKIKLWVRAVRVLAGFIREQHPVGPMLRWGCDTMRLHKIAMRSK